MPLQCGICSFVAAKLVVIHSQIFVCVFNANEHTSTRAICSFRYRAICVHTQWNHFVGIEHPACLVSGHLPPCCSMLRVRHRRHGTTHFCHRTIAASSENIQPSVACNTIPPIKRPTHIFGNAYTSLSTSLLFESFAACQFSRSLHCRPPIRMYMSGYIHIVPRPSHCVQFGAEFEKNFRR